MSLHAMRVAPLVALAVIGGSVGATPPAKPSFLWTTVVNNGDAMPLDSYGRTFNSYNQPSVNVNGVVVIRARSRGGEGQGQGSGMPTHGIYIRDMLNDGAIERVLDRKVAVPAPNNLMYPVPQPQGAMSLTRFIETPSFPRIDMWSNTIATRGNHQPVWAYPTDEGETRVGTTGIYTNPFGPLITGASKLGAVPVSDGGLDFGVFAVPGVSPATMFDVFPGSPAVTGGGTIVFKGNYTVEGVGKTGVFYRELSNADGGGTNRVVLIANNTQTVIPGRASVFGSLSPPTAADGRVVFAGFDNEQEPTMGGVYLAPLAETPELTPLVEIGSRVPGESSRSMFAYMGEGAAFDGRYVGFWGAWGAETRTVRLYCPTEGNKDRIAYCEHQLTCGEESGLGDPNTKTEDGGVTYFQEKEVPVRQGIFVHDTFTGKAWQVAKTGPQFDDFLFWAYSGRTPCTGSGGHGEEGGEDDGEFVRWRSSAFVAVSGILAAFKATGRDGVGIYLFDQENQEIVTVADTRMAGQILDPEAPPESIVTELGLEREGLRGRWLVISAKMGIAGGTEEEGMAGIYLTTIAK